MRSAAAFCATCGHPVSEVAPPPRPSPRAVVRRAPPATDGVALASLFAGVGAWIAAWFIPVVGSVIAVGLGHFAQARIKRSSPPTAGKGFALAGLLLGYSALAPTAVLALFSAQPAKLAIQVQPEQPFQVAVSTTA